jgi:murein DD-endopeptidase MepM/ murein hydrolase activator NlpD
MPISVYPSGTIDTPVNQYLATSRGNATSYLVASGGNHYWAKSTTAIGVSTSWQDTGLTWSNLYMPTNFSKVLLWFHLTLRNNGANYNHTSFRMRVVRGDGTTTFSGEGSWGWGISMIIDSSKNHWTICQHVNLLDYDSAGNQAGLTAANTYTMYLQVRDASANGSNLRLAAEADGTHQQYTPCHGSIWVI